MTPIKNQKGLLIGYEHHFGYRKEIRDSGGLLVAWHDKNQNKTFDRRGLYAGPGDQAMRFLQDRYSHSS